MFFNLINVLLRFYQVVLVVNNKIVNHFDPFLFLCILVLQKHCSHIIKMFIILDMYMDDKYELMENIDYYL